MASDAIGTSMVAAEAAADLSARKYAAVSIGTGTPTKVSWNHQVDVTAAGGRPNGYLCEEGAANEGVHYMTANAGVPQIGVAGAAIATAGLQLIVGANGRLIPSTSGTSGDAIVGTSLAPASGDGSRFQFLPDNGLGSVA